MSKKEKFVLDDNKLRELKVSDSLTNLEEFTRILTDHIDFNSFDILSVTRIDTDEPYTRTFAHSHVDTQVYRIEAESSENQPLGIGIRKLN